MIRIVVGALIAGIAAALILAQMQSTTEIFFWEALLVVVVALQYRGIPGRGDPLETPLFRLPSTESTQLPRVAAVAEMTVLDALTGYVSPDRRLRPALVRIADHRLGRVGLDRASPQAAALLGEENWKTLNANGDQPPSLEELGSLVAALEEL